MSNQDAYAPPRSTVKDVSGGEGMMSERVVQALRKTRPWVLLIAIVGFIMAALMVVMAIPMFMGASSMSSMGGAEGMGGPEMMMGGGFAIGMGVLYILIGIIYFFLSLYLLRYAGAIKRAVNGLDVANLEAALDSQASFWKMAGILTLLSIVLTILFIVIGIGSAVWFTSGGM